MKDADKDKMHRLRHTFCSGSLLIIFFIHSIHYFSLNILDTCVYRKYQTVCKLEKQDVL